MNSPDLQIVVDNSAGGDARFAEAVTRGLSERGFTVELREPGPGAMLDTGVHFVLTGLSVRVSTRPDRAAMVAIQDVVRAAFLHRPRQKQGRAVAVHLGETARVVA